MPLIQLSDAAIIIIIIWIILCGLNNKNCRKVHNEAGNKPEI